MNKTFYIIDGHYQIYRAYYAPFRDLTSPSGEPTKAIHVFCQMLLGLLRDRRPDYLAVAMDSSDETVFRRQIDPDYKAHRDPAPDDFHAQADRILSIIQSMGVPVLIKAGFEADDLMATLCRRHAKEGTSIYLVSRDKDLEQLLNDHVFLYDPMKSEIIDAKRLEEIKGYTPEQAVEIQTLTGDATDNVPGIAGVGPKTALKWIQTYGTAQAVLDHADDLTPRMRDLVKAYAPRLEITRQLVTLRHDVPFEIDLERCACARFTPTGAMPVFEELGFRTIRRQWSDLLPGPPRADEEAPPATLFPDDLAAPSKTLFLDNVDEEPVDYRLVDTPEKFDDFLKRLKQQKQFAFDTETTALNVMRADLVGLSFCWRAGEAYYLPVRAAMGDTLPETLIVKGLKPIMEDEKITKVGQNLKYDMLVLKRIGIETRGPLFDTMIASFVLDPLRASHGLDALAHSLLGHAMIPITDLIGKGKNQISMDQLGTNQVLEYAAEDADYTWRLKEVFEPRIAESPVRALFEEIEIPMTRVLTEMEHNGILLDPKRLTDLSHEMERQLEELRERIIEIAGRPFNVDSPKQLAEVLFDELGLSVVKKTKTGRSTDADTLAALAKQTDNPIPRLLLHYREIAKLKGTYVDTLPRMINPGTGRIHASFNQTIAVTGRLSSNDPNLQNIPIRTPMGKRIRQAFVAAPGAVLLVADYSQIELRLLAHFCRDRGLLEAFERGEDIHRAVAAQVNGVAPEAVTSEQRSAAKAVNFGIVYGQTAFGLAQGLGVSRTQAQTFIDRYFERYPGIASFVETCVRHAREKGYVETILGRRRPIPELKSSDRQRIRFGERIAVNTVVQGSAADLIKRAMVDIHHELTKSRRDVSSGKPSGARAKRPPAYFAKMVAQVHDELVFEVDRATVEDTRRMIVDKMTHAIPLDVPIVVDVGWGQDWLSGK